MKPIITVKNVKYSEFMSEETLCFEATVYVDGKRFCIAKSEGHGGCTHFNSLKKGEYWADTKDIEKRIADTHSEVKHDLGNGESILIKDDLESLVNDAVVKFLELRDMKRALNNKIVFDDVESGCISSYPYKYTKEIAQKIRVKHDYPDILNVMPENEALELWGKYS